LASKGIPSSFSIFAVMFIVSQSDLLPMMMPTRADPLFILYAPLKGGIIIGKAIIIEFGLVLARGSIIY
jgi:hypothetical protein